MEPQDAPRLIVKSKGSVTVLEGTLDASTLALLEPHLHRIAQHGQGSVSFDCRKLTFISSSGVGALMSLHGLLEPQHRTIELLNVTPDVYRTFEMLNLDRLFQLTKLTSP